MACGRQFGEAKIGANIENSEDYKDAHAHQNPAGGHFIGIVEVSEN